METAMTDKIQLLMASLTALGLGALMPLPAFAIDDAHPSFFTDHAWAEAPRLAPRLKPDPRHTQIAGSVESTGSSSSVSASSSASSSVTVTGGQKQGKCRAEAAAHAKANGVEDSDHDLKVVEGDGCSAKAESRATVKPQRQQSE